MVNISFFGFIQTLNPAPNSPTIFNYSFQDSEGARFRGVLLLSDPLTKIDKFKFH